MSKIKNALFYILCFLKASSPLAAQTAPTIQLCDQAPPEICMNATSLDICVTFVIDPNYNEEIDRYELDWLDGSPIVVLPANDPLNDQTHTYDVSNIFENCVWEDDSYRVRLRTFLVNGSAPNSSVDLFLRNPPQARFSNPPPIACTGTEICLSDNSCPTEQLTTSWDFGTGLPPSDNNCFTYQDTGTYTITLMATNPCDQDSDQITIRVVDAPSATAIPQAAIIQGNSSPYRACVGEEEVCITLNGTGTIGANQIRWTVDAPSSLVTINNSDSIVAEACFSTIRDYTFTLEAENTQCNLEDVVAFTVEAIAGEALNLDPQPDACPQLPYTPEPAIDPNATYFIDGVVVNSFPFQMDPRPNPYIIRAEKTTECGDLVVHDTIFVDAAIEPELNSPTDGEAFCPDTSLVALELSATGGDWTPTTGLVVMGEDAFFDRSAAPGDYTFTYTLGEGDCRRDLSFTLTIEDSEQQVPDDFFICQTSDPVSLMPFPDDGDLSGDGVDNNTRTFSPSGLDPGVYPITHVRQNNATTCDEIGSWNAEVVAEPTIQGLDTLSLCNTDQEINLLGQLPNLIIMPTNLAEVTISGQGVVNGTAGTYRPGSLPVGATDTVLVTASDPRTPELCAVTDTLLVFITGIIEADAGANDTICSIGDTYFLGDPAGGRWTGPSASPDGTVDLSALAPGTYAYQLILGEGFCASSDEMELTIVPGNGVTVSDPVVYLCDTAVQLNLPIVTANQAGSWMGDLPVTEPIIDLSGAGPGVYNFQYTVPTLPAGCNSAQFRVEILARPTTTLSGDTIACNDGSCVTFLAGGTPADTYRWQTSDGLSTSGDSICHEFPGAGDYTVSLGGERRHPVDGSVLCRSPEVSSMIRVLDPPGAATITIDRDTVCPGEVVSFSFTAPSSANLEALSYEWHYGDTAFLASGPIDVSFPSPVEDTVYNITLNTLGTCDRAQSTFQLVVRANPVANIGVVYPDQCSGSSLLLTNLATGTLDTVIWLSSDGQRFTSLQPPELFPVTGDDPRDVTYSLIVGNSCKLDTTEITITVEPTQIRALPSFADTTVCLGEPFIVENISTPGTTVEYVFSDGRRFTTDSISVIFSEPGSFSFIIYAYGCGYDSSVWSGTVLPAPEVDFTAPDFVCPYNELPYTLNTAAANVSIYFGDGDSTTLNVGTHTYAPVAVPLSIRYLVTDSQGCQAEGLHLLTVLPQPTAAIAPLDTLCSGVEQTVLSVGEGGQTCRWRFPDGSLADGCEVVHPFSQEGLGSVQLIYTSAAGCADTALVPAFVRPTPDIALAVDYDDDRCGPTEVSFLYQGALQSTSAFELFPGDGSAPLSVFNPVHRYDTSGFITATLRSTYDGVCAMDTEVSFYLRQYPRARTQVQDDRCEAGEAVSVAIITANQEDLIMGSGPADYFSEGINQFNLVTPGDYVFEIISPDGCDTLIDFTVSPIRPLEVSTIENTTIELGDSIRLQTFVNSFNTLFYWLPGGTLSDSTAQSPVATPTRLTTYVLEVTDTLTSCVVRDSVRITLSQSNDIFVPNIFSPNGDGINDVLLVFPKLSVRQIDEVQIFNRWGDLTFSSDGDGAAIDPLTPLWDGRINSKLVNPAVFVYLIKYTSVTGERKVQSGDLTVVR